MTERRLMRKNSRGLNGTRQACEHHAKVLLPFVDALEDQWHTLGFKTWLEGTTVHQFITHDNRKFSLRGVASDGKYLGVRLSTVGSRSVEAPIIEVCDPRAAHALLDTMRLVAVPHHGKTWKELGRFSQEQE